jgi:hypothetical protein
VALRIPLIVAFLVMVGHKDIGVATVNLAQIMTAAAVGVVPVPQETSVAIALGELFPVSTG